MEEITFLFTLVANTLWEAGYALDALETVIPWSEVAATALETQKVIREGLADVEEMVLVFTHLSHVYQDGASIYFTDLYRRTGPNETLRRWQVLKGAASRVILAHGGTISNQHGVGLDHAAYLAAKKGPIGMQTLETVFKMFDPDRMMNPGKLLAI